MPAREPRQKASRARPGQTSHCQVARRKSQPTGERAVMNELLAIAVDRLAEHYHVSGDYLRKALLIRGVAELSGVTDRSKPATPEDLERTLAAMNSQLHEILARFRKHSIEIDDAVQHTNTVLAVVDRVSTTLAGDLAKAATATHPP